MRLEAAEEDIVVYGAQAAVHGVIGRRFYCNRLHDNAFRDLFLCHGHQLVGGRGTYAEVLIVAQGGGDGGAGSARAAGLVCAAGGVDDIRVREGGRLKGERFAGDVMVGEELVQLAEALVVARDAGVKEFVVAAEFYPGRRGDVAAAALAHEVGHAGGVVDIGQHQALYAGSRGELRKAPDGDRAVTKAVI